MQKRVDKLLLGLLSDMVVPSGCQDMPILELDVAGEQHLLSQEHIRIRQLEILNRSRHDQLIQVLGEAATKFEILNIFR